MSHTLVVMFDAVIDDLQKKVNFVGSPSFKITHLRNGTTRVIMNLLIKPKSDQKTYDHEKGVLAENSRENHTAKSE